MFSGQKWIEISLKSLFDVSLFSVFLIELFLKYLQAELRASVFLALEEQDSVMVRIVEACTAVIRTGA